MKYRDHFDHLGQLREGDYMPWSIADKLILAIFVFTVLLLGVI